MGGLYVFARVSLFKNCFELQPAFNLLMRRPLQLHLTPGEIVGNISRTVSVSAPNPVVVPDMPAMSKFVVDFYASKVKTMKVIHTKLTPQQPGKLGVQQQRGQQKAYIHPGGDRDSDEEGEVNTKSKLPTIVNEVEADNAKAPELSAENKAAEAVDKVCAAEDVVPESNDVMDTS